MKIPAPGYTPQAIDARLKARPSLAETAAGAFSLGMLIVFALLFAQGAAAGGSDYAGYRVVGQGDYGIHYYAYWIVPLFWLLAQMPYFAGYVLLGALNLVGVGLAGRVFGGPTPLALISYQMLYTLFYGNIAGLLVGGLALAWWALMHRRWGPAPSRS